MSEVHVQQGKAWLEKLLELSGIPTSIQLDEDKVQADGSYWLTINEASLTPDQIQALTGNDGHVLDAIQYLVNTTINLGQSREEQRAFTIELNGYRAQRQAELQAMAEEAAEQVRATGQEFEMPALSSAERRQVHNLMSTYEDLETYSRGKEPHRRLVVQPLSE